MTTKTKRGAVSAGLGASPLGAKPAPKPSLQALEAFGGGSSPTTSAELVHAEKAPRVDKAQITLHIPCDLEKDLRNEYNAQPAGRRGRFSDYVFKFLAAGRESLGFKAKE
jgi:hypothetical protein